MSEKQRGCFSFLLLLGQKVSEACFSFDVSSLEYFCDPLLSDDWYSQVLHFHSIPWAFRVWLWLKLTGEPCVVERREVDKKQQMINFSILRKELCPPLKTSETWGVLSIYPPIIMKDCSWKINLTLTAFILCILSPCFENSPEKDTISAGAGGEKPAKDISTQQEQGDHQVLAKLHKLRWRDGWQITALPELQWDEHQQL